MALLVVCLLASGCVESLYPVYDTKRQVFETALVGKWVQGRQGKQGKQGESTWTFTPRDENSYQRMLTDEGRSSWSSIATCSVASWS
jgi:DNA topoisomerase IB